MIGLLALGVLLAYVSWDAFGLQSAELDWYACLVGFLLVPVGGFVLYAARNPVAGEVTLELVSTFLGGLMAGFGVMAVLDVIATPDVWFAYFASTVAPTAAVPSVSSTVRRSVCAGRVMLLCHPSRVVG